MGKRSKIEKVKITIKLYILKLGTKFRLKLTVLIFLTKSTLISKGYFRFKKKKNKKNHHLILHIRINLDSNFWLQKFGFLVKKNCQKRILSVKKINVTVELLMFELV